MKYSGMALQMAAMCFIGYWLGQKLDIYLHLKKPLFTILGIIVFFIMYLVSLYFELTKKQSVK